MSHELLVGSSIVIRLRAQIRKGRNWSIGNGRKNTEKSRTVKLNTKGFQPQWHMPVVPARMWAVAGLHQLDTQSQSPAETLQSTKSYKASRGTIRNDQEWVSKRHVRKTFVKSELIQIQDASLSLLRFSVGKTACFEAEDWIQAPRPTGWKERPDLTFLLALWRICP